MTATRAQPFQVAVLQWYASHARRLPWRATRDPYAILVSEVMLQQTQVARVVPAYTAFLQRFPSLAALAAAPTGTVVAAWSGLGYNRRAVNLQRAAQAAVAHHGGRLPRDQAALRALPGVGDYTAAAVRALAFGDDVVPVDVNVARVLARAVAGRPLARRAATRLAQALLPRGRAGMWAQALMDLGATVCVARSPRCGACPLSRSCAWRQSQSPDPAAATAGRSRPQGAFAGSDRFHRGRLVAALRRGLVGAETLAAAAELEDPSRVEGIVAGLVRDGLVEWGPAGLRLPAGVGS